MRVKHRNDKNHGKNGMQSGNARYKRNARKVGKKARTMGKCGESRN